MEKYAILLGYFDKQLTFIQKLLDEMIHIDISSYENRFVFALRTQQFYTALEDLFKQIAKAFENHIEDLSRFHKELLVRMNMEIPKIRPRVLSDPSLSFLDKIRAFRHFVRHAYDCELDPKALRSIQENIMQSFSSVKNDLHSFRSFILKLSG